MENELLNKKTKLEDILKIKMALLNATNNFLKDFGDDPIITPLKKAEVEELELIIEVLQEAVENIDKELRLQASLDEQSKNQFEPMSPKNHSSHYPE